MLLLVTAFLLVPVLFAAGTELLPKDDFIKQWEISKQFTLDVAANRPAEHHGFKPTPEQMSFSEQLVHIAASLLYRSPKSVATNPT
jgi:hypothetical protein